MDKDNTKIIKFKVILIIFLNSSVNKIFELLSFSDSFNIDSNLFLI